MLLPFRVVATAAASMRPRTCLQTFHSTFPRQTKSFSALPPGSGGHRARCRGACTLRSRSLSAYQAHPSRNVNFQGVIPGGESFSIPTGSLTNVTGEGTGFSWVPSVRASTTLIIVAGDGRGLGNGGSVLFNVAAGLNPNSSCLTNTSPSSTAGSPAGGSYPTSPQSSGNSGYVTLHRIRYVHVSHLSAQLYKHRSYSWCVIQVILHYNSINL